MLRFGKTSSRILTRLPHYTYNMIAATQSNHPLGNISKTGPGTSPLDEARTRIRNAQMRITKPRIAIIESLVKHEGPISIERIHQDIGASVCDLVTVYRCLSAFENLGLVRRSYLHNGTCLYELTLGSQSHYHIVCKECGRTERVDYFSVEGMERMLQERGYSEVSHVVGFYGICPACQKTASARSEAPAAVTNRAISPSIPTDERIKL
jgi:Fur family ferric uptake transcriptional regulator